jgi:hypothetical protein
MQGVARILVTPIGDVKQKIAIARVFFEGVRRSDVASFAIDIASARGRSIGLVGSGYNRVHRAHASARTRLCTALFH